MLSFLFRGEDAVGDGGGLDGGADVVDAEDVGSGEDGGYVGGRSCLEAVLRGRCGSVEQDGERRVLGEGVGEEAFAGDSREEGQAESVELALDYVRSTVGGSPMITKAQMTLLPQLNAKAKGGGAEAQMIQRAKAKALENAVVTLLNMTVADKDGVIYAFGSAFSDKGKVDGIHDIHMNQGNPKGNHGGDNGVWQDGALFIHLPSKKTWTAVFLAFQTESWTTDSAGNPEKA